MQAQRSDNDFLAAFENCSLPAEEWTHAAHIRMAWLQLGRAGFDVALARIRNGILRYNTEVLEVRQKYHETVTIAYTRLVADRMITDESWADFQQRNTDLLSRDEPVLLRYYTHEVLFSDDARLAFVEPDLIPLPDIAEAG